MNQPVCARQYNIYLGLENGRRMLQVCYHNTYNHAHQVQKRKSKIIVSMIVINVQDSVIIKQVAFWTLLRAFDA